MAATVLERPPRSLFLYLLAWSIMLAHAASIAAPASYAQASSAAPPPASPSAPQAAPVLAFDVASIRIDNSDASARSHIISSSNDSLFRAINVTLKSLLQWAYAIPDTRIEGGPAWLGQTKFDIEAKGDPAADDQMHALSSDEGRLRKREMLQALLAERFGVKVHEESRQLPIYALVLAKDGPKFQPSQINGTTVNGRRGEIHVQGSDDTVALLADELAHVLGRVVVNQTGLHERSDLDLKWTPDDSPASANSFPTGDSPPSIFTAIQEQLGLKLVSQKGPVSVLVLDQVQMPSEN